LGKENENIVVLMPISPRPPERENSQRHSERHLTQHCEMNMAGMAAGMRHAENPLYLNVCGIRHGPNL
jgi:hypothetical protein